MIVELRKKSIHEASENINEIIRSVSIKERNLITYELEGSDKELIKNLKTTIKKEQELIKSWIQEQFKVPIFGPIINNYQTLRLIREEIKDLREYIDDLKKMHGYNEEGNYHKTFG